MPGEQDLLLQAATSAIVQERLRVLEVVMRRDQLARDFTRIDGPAIERGDNADRVRFHGIDMGAGPAPVRNARRVAAVMTVNSAVLMRYVPAVMIASWRPFSPPLRRKGARVLEIIAGHGLAQDALGGNRRAGIGQHEPDFARGDAGSSAP